MRTLVQWIKPFFWKRWSELIGPDDLLRMAASGFHPDHQDDAETVWNWLALPEAGNALGMYCAAAGPWPGAEGL